MLHDVSTAGVRVGHPVTAEEMGGAAPFQTNLSITKGRYYQYLPLTRAVNESSYRALKPRLRAPERARIKIEEAELRREV